VAAVLVVDVALGAVNWVLQPDKAMAWALSMFMLPAAWGFLALLWQAGGSLDGMGMNRIRRALVGAGLLLMASMSLALLVQLEWVDGSFSDRGIGVVMGVMLVIIGNGIPKTLDPLRSMRHAAQLQALQRFSGRAFVLAGLGYAIVSIVAPLQYASAIATLIVATCLAVVATRYLRLIARRARDEPSAEV
jgi:hypothetical protein